MDKLDIIKQVSFYLDSLNYGISSKLFSEDLILTELKKATVSYFSHSILSIVGSIDLSNAKMPSHVISAIINFIRSRAYDLAKLDQRIIDNNYQTLFIYTTIRSIIMIMAERLGITDEINSLFNSLEEGGNIRNKIG